MASWKVGVSKVDITPTFPVYLGGYGSRTEKHDDVLAPIFARALALEDASGTRAVQLSIELIGVSNELVDSVREAVAEHGVEGAAVRLTATHTHSAPSMPNTCASTLSHLCPPRYHLTGHVAVCGCCPPHGWANLHPAPEDTTREQGIIDIAEYEAWVTPKIIEAATTALASLLPATLEKGTTTCTFAVNRRNNQEDEVEAAHEAGTLDKTALNGPFDHDVELLLARDSDGTALAVAFGCASPRPSPLPTSDHSRGTAQTRATRPCSACSRCTATGRAARWPRSRRSTRG